MFSLILALVVATLVGGAAPSLARGSHRSLHLLVALATGMFLGMVFLHLLPSTLIHDHAGESTGGGLPQPWPGGLVLIGVLVPFAIQNLVLPGRKGGDRHVTTSWGALFGLTLHALAAGFGLAGAGEPLGFGSALFLSILIHKLAEGFSISTVFLLSGTRTKELVPLLFMFSLATPVGLFLGQTFLDQLGQAGLQACAALAAGTFLFVAIADLLPEVFHGRTDMGQRLFTLCVGVALAALLESLGV